MKIIAALSLGLLLPAIAFAHSGRTNGQGCHNDNVHGGYHCHNGSASSAPKHRVAPTVEQHEAPSNLTIDGQAVDLGIRHRYTPAARSERAHPPVRVSPAQRPVVVHRTVIQPLVVRVEPKAAPKKPVASARHIYYFENCDQAWLAGHAPLKRGDDGYRDELDPDGDGLTCQF